MTVDLTTEEANKLIAEFMGGKFIKSDPMFLNGNSSFYYFKAEGKSVNNLQYHSSWASLMPVVEKIDSILFGDTVIEGKWCVIKTPTSLPIRVMGETKIQAVWLAVVQFIQWYKNENTRIK